MLSALALAVLLAADPAPNPAELRRALDGVAERIAELKARALEGEDVHAELEPLLVRAQDLADALDRASPGPAATRPPSAQVEDLRARADALYEEADALAGALAELEARISAALAAGARPLPGAPAPLPVSPIAAPSPRRCDEGAPPAAPPPAVAPLLAERARLKARVRVLLAEASALDDSADRLEK
jgi:hypothetical protein